jgi:hypothetical protein
MSNDSPLHDGPSTQQGRQVEANCQGRHFLFFFALNASPRYAGPGSAVHNRAQEKDNSQNSIRLILKKSHAQRESSPDCHDTVAPV